MSSVIRSSDRSGSSTGLSTSSVSIGTTQSSRSANPDQWYLDEIEKYKGTDFYDYLLTNPHLISNSGQYSPYWYEELLGVSDVNADRYNNQLRSDALNWLGNALSEKHVEEYSDPVAEVARRRSAGINDDLSGGSQIGSGTPANPQSTDTDTNLPSPTGADGAFDVISTGLRGVMNVFSSTMSFVGQMKDFQLKNLNLASNELNTLTSADSWLSDMLSKTIRYNFDTDKEFGKSDTATGAWSKALSDALVSITESDEFNRLSPYTRKAVRTIVSNYDADNISSKALYEKMKNDYLSNRQKNVSIQSSATFSEFLNDWISNAEPYMKSLYEAEMKEFEARQKSPDKVDAEIASLKASARSSNASATMTEYRKSKVETIGTLFDNIKKAIPSDAWYKGIAEWFTEMSRIMTIQALIKE